MNSQELRALQESYFEVYEEVLDEKKYEADEKLPGSGKTPNEKMWGAQAKHGANYMSARGDVRFRGNPKNSSHSRGTKVGKIKDIIASGEDPRNSSQAGIGWGNDARKIGRPGDRPGDRIKKTNRTEDDDAKSTHTQGGLRAHKTRAGGYRTLKKSKKVAEGFDIYDVILSHLLDEGYADTQEQAEVIMVNMSEDWRESIVESRVSELGDRLKDLQQRSANSDEDAKKTSKLARKHFTSFSKGVEKFSKGVDAYSKATEKG